jgi:cyclopropane fatty-acyl-phospholipid synthase-like methyltransferase
MDARFGSWDGAYSVGQAAWDIGRPQRAVVRLAESAGFSGRVLDAGCGSGENALYLATAGLDVVGVDGSATAIEQAKAKAAGRALRIEFVAADACDLDRIPGPFETVLDCGLFHTFDDQDRVSYVAALAGLVPRDGRVQLLCFSDREPWHSGPRLVTHGEIRAAFADGWRVLEIVSERFETRFHESGAKAWRATILRTAS